MRISVNQLGIGLGNPAVVGEALVVDRLTATETHTPKEEGEPIGIQSTPCECIAGRLTSSGNRATPYGTIETERR